MRLVEIAELFGVSKQRAHQIADEEGFPPPATEDGRGRLWDRRKVERWAKALARGEDLALSPLSASNIARAEP